MKDLELKYCFVENREKQNPATCPNFNYNNHPAFKMLGGDETDGYLFCNKANRVIKEIRFNETLERIRSIPGPKETKDFFPFFSKLIGDIKAPKWCPLKKK